MLPPYTMRVVIGLFILCAIAGFFDWLLVHPLVLFLVGAAIIGGGSLMVWRKRARNLV